MDVLAMADEYLDLDCEVRQVEQMIKDAQAGRRATASRLDAAGKRLRSTIETMRQKAFRAGDLVAMHRSCVLVADDYGGVSARHVDRLESIEALRAAGSEEDEA